MGKKSREKYGAKIRPPITYVSSPIKRQGLSNAKKIFLSLTLIAFIVISASVALSSQLAQNVQTQGQGYPQNVSPVAYALPSVSLDNSKVTVPNSYVNSSKLVFVDLKLTEPLQTLDYQGRTIPLMLYKNGQYLPLVVLSTPSGNTVAGIRTCEPCGSFSFHIVKGANLKCDTCGAEWTLETFAPVSGGCATYPPPKLPTTITGDDVTIDLSTLQLQYLA